MESNVQGFWTVPASLWLRAHSKGHGMLAEMHTVNSRPHDMRVLLDFFASLQVWLWDELSHVIASPFANQIIRSARPQDMIEALLAES